MILSYIWISFLVVSFLVAVYQYMVVGNVSIFQHMVDGLFSNATDAVMKVALPLIGIMAFWLGIMKIAEKAGLIQKFSKWLHPFFSKLFPSIPKDHPAIGNMTMNFSANLLGLDNAATPFGLKSMQSLQELNGNKQVASNAQIMFVLLHTSGLTLIPVSVMAQRAIYGANNPSDVFIPIAVSTTFTTLVSLIVTSLWQRIRLRFRFLLMLALFLGLFAGFVGWVYTQSHRAELTVLERVEQLPPLDILRTWDKAQWEKTLPRFSKWLPEGNGVLAPEQLKDSLSHYLQEEKGQFNALLSNITLLLIPLLVIFYGIGKKNNVFEDFVEGAQESFGISIKIIPYLVGLLIAIGMLRSSGCIDLFVGLIDSIVRFFGIDTSFVPSLSTALMKPLSGSGARAIMIETMKTYGADSFVGRLSCIFNGTSETLVYVVALYFGSVAIKNTRYTLLLGLFIDIIGIVGAIFVGYFFFR